MKCLGAEILRTPTEAVGELRGFPEVGDWLGFRSARKLPFNAHGKETIQPIGFGPVSLGACNSSISSI